MGRYCIDVTKTNNFLKQTAQSNNVNMKKTKTYRLADQNSKTLNLITNSASMHALRQYSINMNRPHLLLQIYERKFSEPTKHLPSLSNDRRMTKLSVSPRPLPKKQSDRAK